MSEITIEKGVPMPERMTRQHAMYPFRDMEVGDSFFVQCDGNKSMRRKLQSSISAKASHLEPKKFITRAEGDGVRVWRAE